MKSLEDLAREYAGEFDGSPEWHMEYASHLDGLRKGLEMGERLADAVEECPARMTLRVKYAVEEFRALGQGDGGRT